eukprot:3984433-Amphidinium_carterae.2
MQHIRPPNSSFTCVANAYQKQGQLERAQVECACQSMLKGPSCNQKSQVVTTQQICGVAQKAT